MSPSLMNIRLYTVFKNLQQFVSIHLRHIKCTINHCKGMKTRMHSSRMRTVRCSGRLGGGGAGVCPGGCLTRGGVSDQEGYLPRGQCLPRWVSVQGGFLPGGELSA